MNPSSPQPPHIPDTPLAPSHRSRARVGKIARLPLQLRNRLNQLLDDGLPYAQIVLRLNQSTPLPYPISERNISHWRAGGYQDWLRDRRNIQSLAATLEPVIHFALNSPPDLFPAVCLQLAAARILEFLSATPIPDPKDDPAVYLRILSAMPRIAKAALDLRHPHHASPPQPSPPNPVAPLSPSSPLHAAPPLRTPPDTCRNLQKPPPTPDTPTSTQIVPRSDPSEPKTPFETTPILSIAASVTGSPLPSVGETSQSHRKSTGGPSRDRDDDPVGAEAEAVAAPLDGVAGQGHPIPSELSLLLYE